MPYGQKSLFKQGLPISLKFILYVLASIVLIIADGRFEAFEPVRHTIATVLYPVQRIAMAPYDMVSAAGEYFVSIDDLNDQIAELRKKEIDNAQTIQRSNLLENENNHLRDLLGMKRTLKTDSLSAEILYDAKNVFIRKVVINQGTFSGIKAGQPVIDEFGVVGQVSDVAYMTAEVTLLTDKDQAIPVLNSRSGERSIAYGMGESGWLELRYMSNSADFKNGDELVTSGIDGIYPAGVKVGRVVKLADDPNNPGDHYACLPVAGINRHRQVLVLLTDPQAITARPDFEAMAKERKKQAQREARQAALKQQSEKKESQQ